MYFPSLHFFFFFLAQRMVLKNGHMKCCDFHNIYISHLFVTIHICQLTILSLFYQFFYCILELFRQCGIFVLHFIIICIKFNRYPVVLRAEKTFSFRSHLFLPSLYRIYIYRTIIALNKIKIKVLILSEINVPNVCYGVLRHFQQYFSYMVAVNFTGGGNRSTLTNFIT